MFVYCYKYYIGIMKSSWKEMVVVEGKELGQEVELCQAMTSSIVL